MEFWGGINQTPRHYSAEETPRSRSIRCFLHMIHFYVLPFFFFFTLVTIPNFIGKQYLSVHVCDVGKAVNHPMYLIQGLGSQ